LAREQLADALTDDQVVFGQRHANGHAASVVPTPPAGDRTAPLRRRPARSTLRSAMVSGPVRVLVVDDQAVVRDATCMMLEASLAFQPVGEAASGREALAAIEALALDLVLFDVCMPEMDGLETVCRIRATQCPSVVVLMST